jgi:hypothetical protein
MSWVLVSQSGRRRVLGDTRSDGTPNTREDAERLARLLGFTIEDDDETGQA